MAAPTKANVSQLSIIYFSIFQNEPAPMYSSTKMAKRAKMNMTAGMKSNNKSTILLCLSRDME